MARTSVSNPDIAALLDRIADLLDAKGENLFRVRSYRNAAQTIGTVKSPIAKLVAAGGTDDLTRLKGVGEKLAGLVREYVTTGRVEMLESLEKEVPEEKAKAAAARKTAHVFEKPIDVNVALILEIDEEYRAKAAAGELKKIAPRLMNPEKKAWLPILSTEKKGYKFTVMFSNTERAHELGKTNDWVVVYFSKGKGENQCTVVIDQRGSLKGKRVIRGLENECATFYAGKG